MAGIATAMGAEPEVTGDVRPRRQTRECPECGAKRHTAASNCTLYQSKPKEAPARVRADVGPKRVPLKPQQVAQNVGVCINLVQSAVFTMRPDLAEDQLTPDELGQLSYALTDELLSHEAIVRWIQKASGAGVHIRLAIVCYSIALPRMVKHGLIPGHMAGAALDAMVPAEETPPAYTQDVDEFARPVVVPNA